MITEKQLANVPKYAQEEIERLNQSVKQLERALSALSKMDRSNVSYEYGLTTGYLPETSHITFSLGDDDNATVQCHLMGISGERYVEVTGLHGNCLSVDPCSSNVLRVHLKRAWVTDSSMP